MKVTSLILVCICSSLSAYSLIRDDAEKCNPETCSSDSCRCSSASSPLPDADIPQLISITIDEAVLNDTFTNVWEPLLFNRSNPDGNPIGVTFFVSHEYTDYSRVQDLYLRGFEIGVNSITKNSSSDYWSKASEDTLVEEFQGQRIIVSHFANIPDTDIIGARTPQLQLQGDVSINAYITSGIEYDSSWTSRSSQMYFPYTLDYLSTQQCRVGTKCPTESHPGFWIAPIIDLQGNSSDDTVLECASLLACQIQGSAEDIANWLLSQVERERSTTKAPLTILLSSAWFRSVDNSYEAFEKFLDELPNDVYLVTVKQAIDWAKNPVPIDQFKTEVPERTADCTKVSCKLKNVQMNNVTRYMVSCIPCPEVYPWLGNPYGEANPTPPPNTTTTESTSETTTAETTITTTPPPEIF